MVRESPTVEMIVEALTAPVAGDLPRLKTAGIHREAICKARPDGAEQVGHRR
jgi:hypothetical protein